MVAQLGRETRLNSLDAGDARRGYTPGMKTAVSVPDEVFAAAERLAKRMKLSRSELYSKALSEYVAKRAPEAVTEALDRVCAELGNEPDALMQEAAKKLLERSEW